MKTSRFFAVIALALVPSASLHAAGTPTKKPNVIYIMADELGYFEPGFMGGTTIKTPNLDRMAALGNRRATGTHPPA